YEGLPAIQQVFSKALPLLAKDKATEQLFFLSVRPAVRAGQARTLFWEFALQHIARSFQKVEEARLLAGFLERLSAHPEQLLKALLRVVMEAGFNQEVEEGLRRLAEKWPSSEEGRLEKSTPDPEEGSTAQLSEPKKPSEEDKIDPTQEEKSEPKAAEYPKDNATEEKSMPAASEKETPPAAAASPPSPQAEATTPGSTQEKEEDQPSEFPPEEKAEAPALPAEAAKARRQKPSEVKTGAYIYIQGSGLILLHPFLSTFLRELKLVEDDEFVDEDARQRAVQLLDLLVFGQTSTGEHEMALAKILCEMPLEIPVNPQIAFTETEVEEAEHLLRVVIQHWTALGNTSPAGLREAFLQREGRLERKDNGWHLTVKRKTEDILVDRLPWGRGMIQLPWMKEMLRVEW
ncbi:MAG: hypothetical protein KDD10_25385, partial [Phaeodactylibacter sp.]|nr:hypothetical protein [Phaeodactylibacter sp.]